MNISSLSYNFEQFHALLSELGINFDIIGITETRLKRDILRTNIDLKGYSFEHTPTEASCGGTLLYLKNNINNTLRDDLKIYKSKELESTFFEIINPKEKNIIVGCIYRHPCMDASFYLKNVLQKLSREKSL